MRIPQRDSARRETSRAIGLSPMTARKCPAVTAVARSGSPAPAAAAAPTAATTHTPAAVVSPCTASRRTKMRPAPMKPMPETIWAAIRDGSSTTRSRLMMSQKPYFEISMKSAEPRPTRVWVRIPAALLRHSRSTPMRAESTKASASLPTSARVSPPRLCSHASMPSSPPSPAVGR